MEWSEVCTTTVVPAKPVREHWLPLSNLDRVVMPTYVRVLLMYDTGWSSTKRGYREVLETLKYSLARVLVDFYPMAGRLGVQEQGLVNLHCNGAGAIFTEATVNQNLKDMVATRDMTPLSGLDAAEVGPGPLYTPSQDFQVPALIIQVTRCKCDNIVIAVNWHHTVADVYSGCHFLKSWSELAFGNTQPSLRPVHSRHLVRARTQLDLTAAERWSRMARVARGEREVPPDPPTVLSAFSVSSSIGESLKLEANKGEGEDDDHDGGGRSAAGRRFTVTESVLAHFWRLLAKARRAEEPEDEDNTSRLFMFVEGRKYLNLPPGYFGNVVGCACAVSTEENLINGSLSSSAGLLHRAVEDVRCHEFFQSLIDWVESQMLSSANHEQGIAIQHYVVATIWTYQPLYDLDFGWGRPICALTNPAPRRLFDSLVILPGPHPDGDQKALLQIRASCLSRLETDPEFNAQYSLLHYTLLA